jgi:hypothetical protein
MKKFLALAFAAILLVSCNKDDEQPALATNKDDYHPNTRGTNWTYSGFFATKVSVTGKTKKINGNVYAQLKTTLPEFGGYSILTYLRKEDGNYYYRGEGFNGDYLFLRDNVEVGTTWTAEMKTEDGIEENELEIIEVGGSYLINNFTFNDVIVVKVISYDEEDPEITYETFNYYAKGVGLVLTTDGTEFFNQSITAYTIK